MFYTSRFISTRGTTKLRRESEAFFSFKDSDGGNVIAAKAISATRNINSRVGWCNDSVLRCVYRFGGAHKIHAGASTVMQAGVRACGAVGVSHLPPLLLRRRPSGGVSSLVGSRLSLESPLVIGEGLSFQITGIKTGSLLL